MSSGKVQVSGWRQGQRQSQRISALDACKARRTGCVGGSSPADVSNEDAGRASRTRGKKKRVLGPSEDKAVYHQARHKDHETARGQQSTQHVVSSKSSIPEKHILELVLDTLQRRDSYEIFAEPVDPSEVEDYYKIIEEPMDFGTMRAKLHEGMYRSLEQFEHDVFLITKNAMHFNSSATLFFRQARAIHELAKRVFHLLRSCPEGFELQLSESRRRTGRRSHAEVRHQSNNSSKRCAANRRSYGNGKSNATLFSRGPSNPMSVLVNRQRLGSLTHMGALNELDSGYDKDEGQSSVSVVDRQSSYRPWTSQLNESYPIIGAMGHLQSLVHIKQQDISYRESLMLFSKGLGPTVQNIIKRKLEALEAALNPSQPRTVLDPTQENHISPSSLSLLTKNVNMSRVSPSTDKLQLPSLHKSRDPCSGVSNPPEVRPVEKADDPMQLSPQFHFDLPYLKARLDLMNSLGEERLARPCFPAKEPSLNKNMQRRSSNSETKLDFHCYSRKRRASPLDAHHRTDFTLRL